ncbi:LPS export ABC transporter periplasmic protein LptC [Sinorhizobium sp. RAC02]|uniref:LPS export ABC transporter periplasmic protein LptC n=1 Tax=Sinorhizobium sp. RAC02 TaxID=1842534 RepID=UPI00083CCDBC|nr:LPS export ABC transporter periplasmic protein LptC [Sinorhizobium sp. RAC02]AOF89827.1 lipopolysaccharide-assembly, LptC-related family protein [Sinorhizobium sp. RAC02]
MLDTVTEAPMTGAQGIGVSAEAYRLATRHSSRVRVLKVALPVIAIIIGVIFVIVSIVRTYVPDNLQVESASIEDGKIVMRNPAISGRNKDGISYSMKAERALQDIKQPDVLTLENIRAKVPVNESTIAEVIAATGVYDRGKNLLDMIAPFTINLNTGLEAAFRSAHLDIDGGNMSTEEPVSIRSREASIVAQSLRMTDKGRVVVFEGKVVVDVDPAAIRNREK